MRNECNIIRDILPLYAEKMASPDTTDFVEAHLKNCEACRKEYERAKESQPVLTPSDTAPLLKLRKKMRIKKIQTIVLTAVFVIALLVSAYAVLDAPLYFPYTEGLITAEPVENGGLRITFDEAVTNFDCVIYPDPDGGKFYYCDIQAWTSLWDKWLSKDKGALSTTVFPKSSYPITVEYLPNDGSESICVYGNAGSAGQIVLPRLALGYYLILAIAAAVVMVMIRFLTRRKAELRVWAERIGLYPVSYIISHCIVAGIHTPSYSLPRDFSLIIFISVLLYSGLLLAHSIWRLKKEIREIN